MLHLYGTPEDTKIWMKIFLTQAQIASNDPKNKEAHIPPNLRTPTTKMCGENKEAQVKAASFWTPRSGETGMDWPSWRLPFQLHQVEMES